MLKKNFNKVAKSYDQHAVVQQITGKKLLNLIKEKNIFYKNIIDLGCGTGLVTREFANTLCFEKFYALDMADQLLIQAQKNLAHIPIQITEATIENFQPPHLFNLIYANLSLHWCDNINMVIQHWLKFLDKKGLFAFTIPLHGTFNELVRRQLQIQAFIKKESILQHFNVVFMTTEHLTFEYASLMDACQSLKKTGTNVLKSSAKGLSINRHLQQLLLNRQHDSTTLTYHIGYFILENKNGE